MVIFPSIDLRAGRCVSLRQGEPDQETVYGDDPVAVARRWVSEGARWLHIVNLDGALEGALRARAGEGKLPINLERVRDIADQVEVPIQFGGGLRSAEDIELAFGLGVHRVVLGTIAVQRPELVSEAVVRFGPERVIVAIDARDGVVATHGWREMSGVTVVGLGREMHQRGVEWAVHTDIARDSMLSGVNVSSAAIMAMQTGLRVIASGGVASLDDIWALKEVEASGVAGAIIGKALYAGAIDLGQAIDVATGS